MVDDARQIDSQGPVQRAEPTLELGHTLALGAKLRLGELRCVENGVDELAAEFASEFAEACPSELDVAVGSEAQT